jgi:hypothetical protein
LGCGFLQRWFSVLGAVEKRDAPCRWHSTEDGPHVTLNEIWFTGGIGLIRFKAEKKKIQEWRRNLVTCCSRKWEIVHVWGRGGETRPWKETAVWTVYTRMWLSCLSTMVGRVWVGVRTPSSSTSCYGLNGICIKLVLSSHPWSLRRWVHSVIEPSKR